MMYEEICTYEVSKLAKEKGFNVPTAEFYNEEGNIGCYPRAFNHNEFPDGDYAAPTQSLLQRWLREEKGVFIDVCLDWQYNIEYEEIRYQYRIGGKNRLKVGNIESKGWVFDRRFASYELALEDALKYALENLV